MRISTLIIAAIALACSCGKAAENDSFELWCGDELCMWHVERGEVASVRTWASSDLGIDFVGSDVAIDLATPLAAGLGEGSLFALPRGSNCLVLTVTANVDTNADVTLNLDVNADGTIEFTQPIPTSSWAQVSLETTIEGWFQGLRFEIVKRGSGNAMLADLHAHVLSSCGDLAPSFIAPPVPIGARCGPASCEAGTTCVDNSDLVDLGADSGFCAGCGSDGDCGSGDVCGAGAPISPTLWFPAECVPAKQTPLGEPCINNQQCVTGICAGGGVCSGCGRDSDCNGGMCGSNELVAYNLGGPFVCNQGKASGEPGAWCLSGSDCVSGTCNGTMISQCTTDYRACTSGEDCTVYANRDDPFAFYRDLCVPGQLVGGTCR